MREDCNVISVDWSILADGDYDYVAINNVPTAGVTTGAFVDFLVQQGTPLTAFHLIGFSMGVRQILICWHDTENTEYLFYSPGIKLLLFKISGARSWRCRGSYYVWKTP